MKKQRNFAIVAASVASIVAAICFVKWRKTTRPISTKPGDIPIQHTVVPENSDKKLALPAEDPRPTNSSAVVTPAKEEVPAS